jgi:hypothetical protein
MLGNEKHGAPKIRVEHIRMSDQQRTSKAARGWLIVKITHLKTRNCDTRLRKLGSATMSRRGEAKPILKVTQIPMMNVESMTSSNDEKSTSLFFEFRHSDFLRHSTFVLRHSFHRLILLRPEC